MRTIIFVAAVLFSSVASAVCPTFTGRWAFDYSGTFADGTGVNGVLAMKVVSPGIVYFEGVEYYAGQPYGIQNELAFAESKENGQCVVFFYDRMGASFGSMVFHGKSKGVFALANPYGEFNASGDAKKTAF